MERITLKNHKDLDDLKKDFKEPESIAEILEYRAVKSSVMDNGISKFKEITDLNKISFGHFILIEKILDLAIDSDAKVKMVSPIILRPLGEPKLDNEDRIKEQNHVDNVEDENVGNIYGAFNRFMEIRKTFLYKTYNGVIYGTLDEDDEDDDDEEEGTSTNSGSSARAFHTKKFFWQEMIDSVANGDIFKHSQVVELMMYVVMPHLAQKRSLGIVEYLEHKANNR
jgi:hypothetical protein